MDQPGLLNRPGDIAGSKAACLHATRACGRPPPKPWLSRAVRATHRDPAPAPPSAAGRQPDCKPQGQDRDLVQARQEGRGPVLPGTCCATVTARALMLRPGPATAGHACCNVGRKFLPQHRTRRRGQGGLALSTLVAAGRRGHQPDPQNHPAHHPHTPPTLSRPCRLRWMWRGRWCTCTPAA